MLKVSTKVFLSSILFSLFFCQCTTTKVEINSFPNDLIGPISISELETGYHKDWFTKELATYQVDSVTLNELQNNPDKLKRMSVKIFLGTWCSDSQREVPRFYNIMRFLNITNFELIGMDREKKTPDNLEKGLDIKYVPTIIIYMDGKEVNRIIESSVKTLEKDLISIVQQKNYTPKYKD